MLLAVCVGCDPHDGMSSLCASDIDQNLFFDQRVFAFVHLFLGVLLSCFFYCLTHCPFDETLLSHFLLVGFLASIFLLLLILLESLFICYS